MPSGSGGHGGSHFSGSHSSSHHSTTSHYHTRPIIMGRYYLNTKDSEKVNGYRGLGVLIIFIAFFMYLIAFFSYLDIKTIQDDRDRYLEMIEVAKNDTSYQRQGTITNIIYNNENEHYYFEYYIIDDQGFKLEGASYQVYTAETITQFTYNEQITFAVSDSVVTQSTDSIEMNYASLPLNADGEYVENLNTMRLMPKIGTVALVLSIPFFILSRRTINKNKKEKETFDPKDEKRHCIYCGHEIAKDAKKCDNCGVEF